MATILEFRRPDRYEPSDNARDRAKRGERPSAEIVIFPGVRIERHPGAEAASETLAQPGIPAQAE